MRKVKKVLKVAAGAAVIAVSAVNFGLNSNNSEKGSSGVKLSNAKAMSQVENVWDLYVKIPFEPCPVFIEGEIVPGYEITCFPGNSYPVCPQCYVLE